MDIGRRQCALTDVRIIECSRRIRKERDLIIAEHGVACRCVTAVFRRRAGYDYGYDAPFPQYQIKVGREERAIAVFFDFATIPTARYITCTALTFLGIWGV